MDWHEISKGTPKGRSLATKLLADAGQLVPVDVGSRVVNIDVNVESAYSGATSVYRVFPNGAVDKGIPETIPAAGIEYHIVLTMEFLSEGSLLTETLDKVLDAQPGDDAETLYFRACARFKEQFNVGSFGKVLCWSFNRNALD